MRLSILTGFLAGLIGLVGLAALGTAHAGEPLPFGRGSWAKLREAHAGQPTVVHFWGLTCGPCLVELPNWGRLLAERKDLNLVLLAADPMPEPTEQLAATLDRAGLGSAESWAFTDRFYERLRYEIDPAWAGELPRTQMIARDGTLTVLRGVVDLTKVRAWLDDQAKYQPPVQR
ncbi:TlpA family protein disulfide reductase [Reyranella sp.]|jgi:thiol-disulfide isomerase/thioredoxin|uniref:TlpA family protein disulfide reductase n=1 Tax=Reyranella sp. TaxID=1929291 RepID=UPI002F924896